MMFRSMLFVPADQENKLEKVRQSAADALILDLEDAVVTERKSLARRLAAEYLRSTQGARPWKGFVRINPLNTRDSLSDLAEVVAEGIDGVVLPKADSADDVIRLGAYLDVLEVRARLPAGSVKVVVIATETPRAILNLASYTAGLPRLVGLTWGAEDLSAAVGAVANREGDGSLSHAYLMARSMALMAAAAAEAVPVDTIYSDFRNLEGLAADCGESRRRGFLGRLAIHPDQVATINQCYTPSAEDMKQALAIVTAFQAQPDAGVVSLDGKMYDRPHLLQAMRTLEQFSKWGASRT